MEWVVDASIIRRGRFRELLFWRCSSSFCSMVQRLMISSSDLFSMLWKDAWWPQPSHSNELETYGIVSSSASFGAGNRS